MPSASASVPVPPHSPQASTWLPKQSQSPRRDAASTAHAALVEHSARRIGRIGVVAGADVGAVVHIVTQSVPVSVNSTSAATYAERIGLGSCAVASTVGDAASTAYAARIRIEASRVAGVGEVAGREVGAVVEVIADPNPNRHPCPFRRRRHRRPPRCRHSRSLPPGYRFLRRCRTRRVSGRPRWPDRRSCMP